VGSDYVVLAIVVPSDGSTKYLVESNKERPSWFPAPQFDLVSSEVPTSWRIRVGDGGAVGRIEIGPEPWLVRGFWEDYWGDDHLASLQAQDVFERERDAILRETG